MCHPCPWTVLLPFSPDRTMKPPNHGLQPTSIFCGIIPALEAPRVMRRPLDGRYDVMRSRNRRSVAWCVLLVVCAGIAQGCSTRTGDLDAALWLPEGASLRPDAFRRPTSPSGRSVNPDGSGEVAFTVQSSCHAVALRVASHFTESGWVPRKTRLLAPGTETSFEGGCERTNGGVVPPDFDPAAPHVEWIGEWEGATGDFLAYSLGGRGSIVEGYAIYIPARLRPY